MNIMNIKQCFIYTSDRPWRHLLLYFFLKNDKIFNADHEFAVFQRLFDEYELAKEGWLPIKYGIDKCPSWSDYDIELTIYSKKPKH